MEISVERYHYPIGQGIFSAQIVRAFDEQYVCVYDCGSTAKTLVKDYVKDLRYKTLWYKEDRSEKPIIDLLVISHLDNDHCNAIEYLFNEGFSIQKLVIPYMSMIERIVFLINHPERLENITSWHLWKSQILIPDDGSGGQLLDNLERVEIIESSTGVSVDNFNVDITTPANPQQSIPVWEFLHFPLFDGAEESVREDFIIEFENAVHSFLGKNIDDITVADLRFNKEKFKAAYRSTRKIIRGKYGIKYNDIFNASSIILYTGPSNEILKLNKNSWEVSRRSRGKQVVGRYGIPDAYRVEHFFNHSYNNNLEYTAGWLGTGDALLKEPVNIRELNANLGWERIDRIRVLTVPHHGSRGNSNDEFYSIFSQPRVECIVHSYPAHQKFRHPHDEVKEAIARKGFVEVPVTKEKESYYAEYNTTVQGLLCFSRCIHGPYYC